MRWAFVTETSVQLLTLSARQAHFDYFHDELNTQNGGQRVATVLLYL